MILQIQEIFNELNAVILLFGCTFILIAALPALLARMKDKKVIKSVKAEKNIYVSPQKSWIFTKNGIGISLMIIMSMPMVLLLSKYCVREWFDIHVANTTKDMLEFLGVSIMFILVTIAGLISYTGDFKAHRNDYIRLDSESIEICSEKTKDRVDFSDIEKIDTERKAYVIYQKSGRKIVILKSLVNRLIGRDELNEKLKKLSNSYHVPV